MADDEALQIMQDDAPQMDYIDMDTPPDPSDVPVPSTFDNSMQSYANIDRGASASVALAPSARLPSSTSIKLNSSANALAASQMNAVIKQYEASIRDLQEELQQARDENERLMVKNETVIIEYSSKIDELNFEIDELQIESQQYQLRYSEINQELLELRSSQADHESSGQENHELLLKLQAKEKNEVEIIVELEQANKQIEMLQSQIKKSNDNLTKLQTGMLKIKKEKSIVDKNMNTLASQYERLQHESHNSVTNLRMRCEQLQRENEIYRQSLSNAEQEKQEMQNNFTEATMELLTDELNEAHDDVKQDVTELRLTQVSASDIDRAQFDHDRNDSMAMDSPVPNSFVKQRFGSQTSLPDTGYLETLQDADYTHHRNMSNVSTDSRMAHYDVDPMKLKQDIREIIVNDIKGILSQELANQEPRVMTEDKLLEREYKDTESESMRSDEMVAKLDQLLELSRSRRKSVDLNQEEEQQKQQNNLNVMIQQMEESMMTVLKEHIMKQLVNSKEERQEFEQQMQNKLAEIIANNNGNNNDQESEEMKDFLSSTIQSQMTVFQIALEKEIGMAVSSNVQHVINDNLQEQLREGIKQDLSQIMDNFTPSALQSNNNNNNNNNSNSVEVDKLEQMMEQVMNGKIDGFMDAFRKEVVPEVEAVFAQLSLPRMRSEHATSDDVDDEKAGSNRDELLMRNEQLRQEIDRLKKEQEEHERVLRNAATSKVHQVVKLQNLLDHMRQDNRVLQFQLEKYHEKFKQIKQQQEQQLTAIPVVNNLWNYFQAPAGRSAHLST